MTRISGVVNTLNEAGNIRAVLGSLLPWCDEVIVVDQHSDDGTADIARELGARVFQHDRTGFVEPARAFAVAQASGDWIVILDADEIIPPPLARRLRDIADHDEPVDVVSMPNVNVLMGRWTRYGKWWPGRKPRMFRRGSLVVTPVIHAGIKAAPGARVLELPARKELAVWHFSYHSVDDMVEKANRYSTIQARQRAAARGRVPQPSPRRALLAAGRRLWREYVLGLGYQDGWVGLTVGVTRAFYSFIETVKRWDEPAVAGRVALVDRTKERLLAGYAVGGFRPAAGDQASDPPPSVDDSRSASAG